MKRLLFALAGLVLLPLGLSAADPLAGSRPNILFLLIDDQGYGDFSIDGSPVLKTPNLDVIGREGVRFSDFHVSPTCSPTRAALMSGMHEFKSGVTHTIFERERMSLATTTIAQILKGAGYATGIFGKWHLGDEPEYQPGRRGFDEVFIHGGGGIGQTFPGSCGDAPGNTYLNPVILHNGVFEKTHGYCTDVFFDRAEAWIASVKDKGPFFCYLATNAPHAPLEVPPGYEKLYRGQVPDTAAAFFEMIANIDDDTGRLLAKLKEWGIDRDTLLIVMNDNGGTFGVKVFNAGMRGQKNSPFEGGTRSASFWRWPGHLQPGLVVDRMAAHIDVFPTLAELAGATVPPQVRADLDGRSLVPLLENPDAPWPDRFLITHAGRWARGKAAESEYLKCRIRNQRYSLICATRDGSLKWQLFDLKTDYGEQHDIAAEHPDIVKEFAAVYDRWWRSIQPRLVNENVIGPRINPFKALYWKQFGGGPTPEELREMDPYRTDIGQGKKGGGD